MTKLLRIGLILGSFFFLTAFEGNIDVKEPLNLNSNKGLKDLSIGEYDLTAERVTSRKLRLEIHTEDKEMNPVLDINFPRGKEMKKGKEFLLSPEESGQNYWVAGLFNERRWSGPDRWVRENCTFQWRERYCWVDRWGRHCEDRIYSRPGFRDVRYYDVLTKSELDISLLNDEADKESVADLSAAQEKEERIIQGATNCQPY